MTDAAGRKVWEAEYKPFGKAIVNQDPYGDGQIVINNLRLPGQYHDAETGLHYNYHRDYDPETGRYLQPDPIGHKGGLNLYVYVDANPIKYFDATGEKISLCSHGPHVSLKIESGKDCEKGVHGQWGFGPAGGIGSQARGLVWWTGGAVGGNSGGSCTVVNDGDSADWWLYKRILEDFSDPPCYNATLFNCMHWAMNRLNGVSSWNRELALTAKRTGLCGR